MNVDQNIKEEEDYLVSNFIFFVKFFNVMKMTYFRYNFRSIVPSGLFCKIRDAEDRRQGFLKISTGNHGRSYGLADDYD